MKLTYSFKSYINEAPISNYETFGFEPSDKNHSFGTRDRRIISHPTSIKRVHEKFGKSEFDYNMYFVNKKGVGQHAEVGDVSIGTVDDWFGDDVYEAVKKGMETDPDALTIIYTNNRGDQRRPMTAWIMAHRMFHAMARGKNSGYVYKQASDHLISMLSDILDAYHISNFPDKHDKMIGGTGFYYDSNERKNTRNKQLIMKNFFQDVCTFKSARDKKIRDWFEVLNELGAQYVTTGRIRFNPPPKRFGNQHIGYYSIPDKDYEEVADMINALANGMEYMISDIISASLNTIFVM